MGRAKALAQARGQHVLVLQGTPGRVGEGQSRRRRFDEPKLKRCRQVLLFQFAATIRIVPGSKLRTSEKAPVGDPNS